LPGKIVIKALGLGLSPEEIFLRVDRFRPCFWLDSSLFHPRFGSWSYLGFEPIYRLRFRGGRFMVQDCAGRKEQFRTRLPLSFLRDFLGRWKIENIADFPFPGGGVGYLSYELGGYLERIPKHSRDDLKLDELRLDIYQFLLGFHHPSSSWFLLGVEGDGFPLRVEEYERGLFEVLERRLESEGDDFYSERIFSNFEREEYLAAIGRAQEYIKSGDIYQVNLCQRFCAEYRGAPARLYLRLRKSNPGTYGAALLYPDFSLLSSSPELFLRVRGREVITRPIKGTTGRGKTAEEDELKRATLLRSEKDLAELVMIVDLERNDLGRVCEFGSVRVEKLAELESYSRVHHLVGTVSGRLLPGRDVFDLLGSAFPGGSITGAPKLRAMEIISELEPLVRGPYTGSLGIIGFSGNLEMNIAIRTIFLKSRQAFFPAGGGIVSDSIPAGEYEESCLKALAMWEALSGGSGWGAPLALELWSGNGLEEFRG
jgi:para-aminobenzoate synthetase component 1